MNQVSKCCKYSFHVEGSDEGTNHYECDKCGNACDVITQKEEKHCKKCLGEFGTSSCLDGTCECHKELTCECKLICGKDGWRTEFGKCHSQPVEQKECKHEWEYEAGLRSVHSKCKKCGKTYVEESLNKSVEDSVEQKGRDKMVSPTEDSAMKCVHILPKLTSNSDSLTCLKCGKKLHVPLISGLEEGNIKSFKNFQPVETSEGWNEIKEKYSQSGYFDNIGDIKELDKDIENLIRKLRQEAYKKGLAVENPEIISIREALSTERKRLREAVEGMVQKHSGMGGGTMVDTHNRALSAVIDILEK